MADAHLARAPLRSLVRVDRWTSLRSVPVTPPGPQSAPRLLLCPLHHKSGAGASSPELRRRAETADRLRNTAPCQLMEFSDRLEAVLDRGTGKHSGRKPKAPRVSSRDISHADSASVPGRAVATLTTLGHAEPTETPAVTGGDRTRDRSTAHCRDGLPAGDGRCAESNAAAASRGAILRGAPDASTRPLKCPKPTSKRNLLCTEFLRTPTSGHRRKEHHRTLNPDVRKRSHEEDDSELLAAHSSNRPHIEFTTPQHGRLSPSIIRHARSHRPLSHLPATDRKRRRCVATSTSGPRPAEEEQQHLEGSSQQCDASKTPLRHGGQPKPGTVSDRWQHMSTGKDSRRRGPSPTVDSIPSDEASDDPRWDESDTADNLPVNKPAEVSAATPRRSHTEPTLRPVVDRCQDDADTSQRLQPEFQHPGSSHRTPVVRTPTLPRTMDHGRWETPTGLPAVPRGRPPRAAVGLSPGGCGDRLRRVQRWLDSSPSVADSTEKAERRRSWTPSISGASTTSSRRRRRRVEYTEEEVQNLLRGVDKFGHDFRAIRLAYDFHPSRTTVDLYDKWRHMPRNRQQAAGAGDARPRADGAEGGPRGGDTV
ncbi:Telomere repeats-binding bouquet formation protein 1 [Amphibalanus amphitrite]|uniref:Telomere repeats-binding bouquet formation protein 1 n=2 Tax=Amphibalanus amphitrite TaxID=1232801 RepID=A0A6A4WFZ1_AMPAM|nr:Telomere repeats-binding bouquet formation protein 1 [Amphibalanus amphitrite]